MLYRSLSTVALAAVAVFGFGCSGSGTSSVASFSRGTCASGAFCLTSCSLGCTNNGCSVTDIAPNQPIRLVFSHAVDITTVDFSTISIKTASGRTPEGRFVFPAKNVVEFRPEIRIANGKTAFGFIANETYVLNLPDASDSGQVLRSVSGDGLSTAIVCSLRVSQRIVDLDGAPPKGELIAPKAGAKNVAKNAIIVIEFSEIIDIAPFQGATTQTSPIQYLIRKTKQNPASNDPKDRVCDQNFNPLILEGLPEAENDSVLGITKVTLRPTVPLPSQICVEVVITPQVRDLAGTPAVEKSMSFTTEILVAGEGEIREVFASDAQLDKSNSSGRWGGGKALPPQIGGTGELGVFNIGAGTVDPNNKNRYIWNTDKMTIDGIYTPNGKDVIVMGGVFEFTTFNLPLGSTLAFEGSNPAQIRVRGSCLVEGKIEANAGSPAFFAAAPNPGSPVEFGQKGAAGNCSGGAGGKGGDRCDNKGPNAKYDGGPGEPVQLPSGNGYTTQAAVSGGKGGPHFPRSGKNADFCALTGVFCGVVGAGGGGGGFALPGKDGAVSKNPCNKAGNSGTAPNSGGGAFDLGGLSNPNTGPNASVNFYAVGGSGGGGGGAHPLLTRRFPFDNWLPGSAGAGGGGVIIFRVGQDMTVSSTGVIQVKGGSGYVIDAVNRAGEKDNLFNVPTPGGGGSGGSILLQVFGKPRLSGLLDCSGGAGGVLDNSPTNQLAMLAKAAGGDGGAGYYRLETPDTPSVLEVGSGIPAPSAKNVGKLTDEEFKGVSQSNFYATKLTFPPTFLRYELECMIDGVRRVYSDDPLVGNPTAAQYDKDYAGIANATQPIHFQLQGAQVSTVTGQPDLTSLGPWREVSNSKIAQSLNDDGATGCRYRMAFDTVNGTKTIEVTRVSVFFVE